MRGPSQSAAEEKGHRCSEGKKESHGLPQGENESHTPVSAQGASQARRHERAM